MNARIITIIVSVLVTGILAAATPVKDIYQQAFNLGVSAAMDFINKHEAAAGLIQDKYNQVGALQRLDSAAAAKLKAEFKRGYDQTLTPPVKKTRKKKPVSSPSATIKPESSPVKSETPKPVSKSVSELEPNDAEAQAAGISQGTILNGAFTFERGFTDYDRFVLDIASPGKYTVIFNLIEYDYQYGFSTSMTTGRYVRGATTVIVENLGCQGSTWTYRVTTKYGSEAQSVSSSSGQKKDKLFITVENTGFNTRSPGNVREVQFVKDGPYLRSLAYQLRITE